jgi:hypothetical protein
VALSLAGMLLPAQHHQQRAAADIPCAAESPGGAGSQASPGAVSSESAPASTPPGAGYELCLSVSRLSSAPAAPGVDLAYAVRVWLASLGTTPAALPAVPATVTLRAGPGGGVLHWAICPGGVNGLDCSVRPVPASPPDEPLQAELTIPAGSQRIGFTVSAADPDSGATNVLPAGPVTEWVTVPAPTASPSGTSPSPSGATPSGPSPSGATPSGPSPSGHSPAPAPAGSHSRAPSPAPGSSGKSGAGHGPGRGTGAGKRANAGTGTGPGMGTGTGGSGPISGVGAPLPPGFTYSPVAGPAGSLGKLPGPMASASVPAVTFPKVTTDPGAAPSPVTLPGPRDARVANTSAKFPLDGRLIGVQVAGLAVLAAAVTIAVARLSLRRRAPRHGK